MTPGHHYIFEHLLKDRNVSNLVDLLVLNQKDMSCSTLQFNKQHGNSKGSPGSGQRRKL